jgi:hypothetical protein
MLELIGSEVRLFCRSSGLPTPTTSWVGPEDNPIINSEKYKILESGDLLIRDLTWDDMGNYMCVVENEHGSDRTSIFLYPTLVRILLTFSLIQSYYSFLICLFFFL